MKRQVVDLSLQEREKLSILYGDDNERSIKALINLIEGQGFFILEEGSNFAFTRFGKFSSDKNGYIIHSISKLRLLDINKKPINVATDKREIKSFSIDKLGDIKAIYSNGEFTTLARIGLALFIDPSNLHRIAPHLFANETNQEAFIIEATSRGAGAIKSSAIEVLDAETYAANGYSLSPQNLVSIECCSANPCVSKHVSNYCHLPVLHDIVQDHVR